MVSQQNFQMLWHYNILKLLWTELGKGWPLCATVRLHVDKFWMQQDVLYDFTAGLAGIGDRSVHESSWL